MTVRDELVELIRSLPEMPGHRWADACAHFVDDHGPALVEALRDAERYEAVRKMSILQFTGVYTRNITTGIAFDALVDAFANGDGTKIEPDRALAEMKRDAERYRWLRERPKSYDGRENGFHVHLAVAKPKPNDWSLVSAYGESLDQAIDRAREGV